MSDRERLAEALDAWVLFDEEYPGTAAPEQRVIVAAARVHLESCLAGHYEIPKPLRGLVPAVGSVWLWEPEKPHARERVVVTAVKWNGEAVWVESQSLDGKKHWNEFDRWVEATVFEGASALGIREETDE